MKTPTHVICPPLDKIPGGKLPEYLTAGKRYEVVHASGPGFAFRADDRHLRIGMWRSDYRLNNADWIPVYADEESMVEGQSVITDNPRHLTAQESSVAKNGNVGAFAKTSPKQTAPTWADVGPGLLDHLKIMTQLVRLKYGNQDADVHLQINATEAAIAAAEKVESHE